MAESGGHWQTHIVRWLISPAQSRRGLRIEPGKNGKGERACQIAR